ncbi:NAD(P)/FAD-dependent oxidoreductase [Paenibacillus sp. NEAU-GSW1]|uniref:phytoene desaturase family protein n=1 Tax=Paenibacillus sp. NEAU-GSW1 TaxID=2682486 RepID=UPI0012E159C4|nr:FAD-dependent oxidoreductase [Paenibacillus sp. NEAU-GSW1]MUT66495.1 FAD-dependent oxidoreductase [Paenibacillus sp. NEAU-GSW1]
MMKQQYDVAIIGGGIAGLIAAAELAKAGATVILLEKSQKLGGRGMTVEKNGSLFNLGGHALYRLGETYSILQELGVKLTGGSPAANPYAIWDNKLQPMPDKPLKLLSSRLLGWSGKIELARFVAGLGKLDPSGIPNMSLREWAEKQFADPMVRHIFYGLCRTATYSKEIDSQLAGPVLRQLKRSLQPNGVLYVDGGWQTIADQLRGIAESCGAVIATGKGAAQIVLDETGTAVHGVQLQDGELVRAERVISTLAPHDTCRLLEKQPESLLQWKQSAQPAMAACLDLALKRLPVPERNLAIGLDRPIFFSNHSAGSKLSIHPGVQVVHLIKYNLPGESDARADELALEKTMDMIQPGWRQQLIEKQYLPRMTVVHDYAHTSRSQQRPGPAVAEILGLYTAGDWASHGEMLVDAAAASARRAAALIVQQLADAGGRQTPAPSQRLTYV